MPAILRFACLLAAALLAAPALADAGLDATTRPPPASASPRSRRRAARSGRAPGRARGGLVGAGLGAGISARARTLAVARRPCVAGEVLVVLDTHARPGTSARGRLGGGCALTASVQVRGGEAAAGARVLVRGEVLPTERGCACATPCSSWRTWPGDVRAAWRARMGGVVDRLFGRDAPLVRALVLAEAGTIDPAVRDRFADAGLVHALSVSGLHVAIIAAPSPCCLRALRLAPAVATGRAFSAVAAYVACLGAPAPAVRAAVMLGADAFTRLVQRPTSPWAVFAIGALAPLHDPRAVWDLGYQLSVAGMAALVAGRTLARRLRRTARVPAALRRGWRAAIAREVLVGALATCVTAPFVAWHFGRVSLVGGGGERGRRPAARRAAADALPRPRRRAARRAPASSRGGSRAPARPARVGGPGRGRRAGRCRPDRAHAGGRAARRRGGGRAPRAASGRRPGRPLAVGAGCLALAAWAPPLASCRARGRGGPSCTCSTSARATRWRCARPGGRWVLVDAGGSWTGATRAPGPWCPTCGGAAASWALLVLSHPHADHVGGAGERARPPRAAETWDAAFALGSETYRGVLEAAHRAGSRWRRVHPGDSLVVDGVALRVLAPDSAWTATLARPNLASVIVAARYGRVRFLLTGDAEGAEERWLVERAASDPALAAWLRADVLKVAHHGSATSTSPAFLDGRAPHGWRW
jgi:competence protein ComEC